MSLGADEVFARTEHEQENDLIEDGPLARRVFDANKLSLGYQRELRLVEHLHLALGGLMSAYAYPHALKASYGEEGIKSFMLYARIRFGT